MACRLNRVAAILFAVSELLGCAGTKSRELLAAPEATPGPMFESRGGISLELRGPLEAIFAERDGERTYHPGVISYVDSSGTPVSLDVRLRIRGRSRSSAETCSFAPIRVRLRKKDARGTIFEGQRSLRLVTHCRPTSSFEQGILLEFLIYRMYNEISDASLRVRLAVVTYVDTGTETKPLTRFGFFVEDLDAAARRLGGKRLEVERMKREKLDAARLNELEVFQYMIGNTDFSPVSGPRDKPCCHNTVLIARKGQSPFAIPYDFDRSGLVNAPYATPHPDLSIDLVTQRLYRGSCRALPELPRTFERLRERRTAIEGLLDNQVGLDSRSRGRARRYIGQFYRQLERPDRLTKRFERRCRD